MINRNPSVILYNEDGEVIGSVEDLGDENVYRLKIENSISLSDSMLEVLHQMQGAIERIERHMELITDELLHGRVSNDH